MAERSWYFRRYRSRIPPLLGFAARALTLVGALFLLVAYSLSAGNAGTAFRYRIHVVGILMCFLLVLRQQLLLLEQSGLVFIQFAGASRELGIEDVGDGGELGGAVSMLAPAASGGPIAAGAESLDAFAQKLADAVNTVHRTVYSVSGGRSLLTRITDSGTFAAGGSPTTCGMGSPRTPLHASGCSTPTGSTAPAM